MNNFKILDCTLRDGGYLNDWNFGFQNIISIINALIFAKIDFIEIGFIKKTIQNTNSAIFSSFNEINELPINASNLCAMINYGDFDLKDIPNAQNSKIKTLRINFKKHNQNQALEFSEKIKQKGYKIFINPSFINAYTFDEINFMMDKINEIEPFCFSIVDSIGAFVEKDLIDLSKIFNEKLNKNIALCFHSHNNLGFSFNNSKIFIENFNNKTKIIDATISNIGRGGGNLALEEICAFNSKYNIDELNEIKENIIKPIISENIINKKYYKLSAELKVHPNYAKYLIENKIEENKAQKILNLIPEQNHFIYNKKIIEKITNNI